MFLNKLARLAPVAAICLLTLQGRGQSLPQPDTLRLTLQEAQKIFLDSNLQLLAQYYNVRSAQALVEQARKWDNPQLMTDQNVYSNKRFFQHGTDAAGNVQGQVFVQVQQLIKTAGKRGKEISLAKTGVGMAEWQFRDVMRGLRAALVRDFYTIAMLQRNAALYNENREQLARMTDALGRELKAGNIARKEYLRIQALLVSLDHDITDNAKAINDAQAELKTLLSMTGNIVITPVTGAPATQVPDVPLPQLVDTARRYNTDYQQQLAQLVHDHADLALQKANAVPNLTVGPEYDQNSNYIPQYYGLSLSLPLPVFDRNQGNIKAAKWQVKQSDVLVQQADEKLRNDVLNTYQKLLYTARLSNAGNEQFYSDYAELQRNITESYARRQISLIEFLQYFNDYQDIRKQQLQQELNLQLARQELNDVVGKDIAPLY